MPPKKLNIIEPKKKPVKKPAKKKNPTKLRIVEKKPAKLPTKLRIVEKKIDSKNKPVKKKKMPTKLNIDESKPKAKKKMRQFTEMETNQEWHRLYHNDDYDFMPPSLGSMRQFHAVQNNPKYNSFIADGLKVFDLQGYHRGEHIEGKTFFSISESSQKREADRRARMLTKLNIETRATSARKAFHRQHALSAKSKPESHPIWQSYGILNIIEPWKLSAVERIFLGEAKMSEV